MLFKISKGLAKDLPTAKTPGQMWLTQDDGKLYVDVSNSERICLNNIPTHLYQLLEDESHNSVGVAYYYNGAFYEESSHTNLITPTINRIYFDVTEDKIYRYNGSSYVEVGSLKLGETATTAYRGDRGKIAYDHSQVTSGNPHQVTKAEIGLNKVENFKAVSTVASQGLTATEQSNARANIGAGTSSFSGSYNDLSNKPTLGTAAAKDVASSGNASTSQVVMGNDTRLSDARPASDVSSWAKASTKPSYTASEVGAIATTAKGAASGVAELDANGKVPSSQLPSFVDDVLEYNGTSSFPTTGETGKIYVDTSTNKTYRWGGSSYVEISPSLALGETSSTAYRGDRGKTAYDHSQKTSGNPHNVTKSDVGLGNVGNFKAVSTVASQGLSSTEQSNARANIGAGTSSFSGSYNDLSNKPTIPSKTSQLTNDSGFITTDTNTHRPIQVNGTEVLGNNTTALNLKAGSNVSITNSSGTVTISATDTKYESKAAASGGTDVSLVTTGEKATWNAKTSNTGTVTSVATGAGLTGGTITGSGTIKAKLKSETASTLDSTAMGSTANRQYAVGVDKSGYLSVNVPWTDSNTNTTYTLSQDSSDGHKITLTPSSGTATTITIPDNNTDTKNTAGSTDTSSKIFLIGATSQEANPQTYSHDTAYVGTDGCLYSGGTKVLTAHQDISGKANLASPALTGTPTAPTAAAGTNTTQIATTAYVMNAFQANDAMVFKGTIGSSGATVTALPATHYQGWTYKVITAGTYAGQACEIGDMIICITDGTSATDAHWTVIQSNIDGAVTGPSSSTDAHVATFNGTSGKVIKDSGYTIAKSVPSNAVFTDTVTTASTSGSGNAVTAISASNGALTVTKGATFLTSHQDISGKADKSATVSTVAWDTTNKKLTKTINGTTSDVVTGATILDGLTKNQVTTALGYTPPTTDTNTHRPIQVNGTEVLGNNTTALNLKAGSNVSLSNSSGTITIAATDTNTWRGISDAVNSTSSDVSASSKAVKTAYDLAASKTANTGTVTKVTAGTGLTGGDITTTGTIALATSGVTAGSAGPTAAVTGNNNTTVAIPRITVDTYGRVTALTSYNLTNVNTDNDTKNTAGSTDTSSKIFLVGATSQAANPQTYSDNEVFATSGVLTTKSVQIGGGAATMQFNNTTKSIDFIFA